MKQHKKTLLSPTDATRKQNPQSFKLLCNNQIVWHRQKLGMMKINVLINFLRIFQIKPSTTTYKFTKPK